MIILRTKIYSRSKESIEQQAARREYQLRHNARVSREEGQAYEKLRKEYEGKLPDRNADWMRYIDEQQKVIDSEEAKRLDSLRAAGNVARNVIGAAGYALGPRKVLDTDYKGEKTKVTVRSRSLRDRMSDFKEGTSDLREKYNNYKESFRQTRGADRANEVVPVPKNTPIEDEYERKQQEIYDRYNPRYIIN